MLRIYKKTAVRSSLPPRVRSRPRLSAAIALILATGTTVSYAQDEGETRSTMRKIVVSDDALDAATEDSGRYTSSVVSTGKALQSIRETPHAVTIITRERLEDQNLTSVSDALKEATGVTVQRFDGAGNFNNYYVRGFQVDAIQLDGLNFGNTGNVVEFDTAMYDRIEILRGPAGLFQGAGEPSAVINLGRKRALAETRLAAAAYAGSWNALRGEADIGGALLKDDRLRARLVAVYDENESYQDVIEGEKKMAYGTLEYDLMPATTLSFGGAWQDIDSVIDQGLPAFATGQLLDVSRATFIGADWNRQELESKDLFVELEHHIANGGVIKAAARKFDRFMLYKVARANGAVAANGNTPIQTGVFSPDRGGLSADVYASLPFEAWGLSHNIVAGVDWRSQEEQANLTPFTNTHTMNVFDPNHALSEPAFVYNGRTETETEQYGAYAQLRIRPAERWMIVGGGRMSWWESSSRNLLTGATTADYDQEGEFTPYAALIFDVLPAASLYASYADVFQPQNSVTAAGNQLPPRTGSQIEIGAKAELLDQALNVQLALFRIRDRDRALSDTSPGAPLNSFVASGEVQSEGFDAEVSGRILPGWDIVLGYAFTETEFVRGTASQTGSTFAPFTPRHLVNLWSKYRFQRGPLSALTLGAGVRSASSFYSQSGTTRFEASGYTVATAQVGYEFTPRVELTMTINNVFDEKYYEKVSGAGRQNFYGEPLNATLSLRARL